MQAPRARAATRRITSALTFLLALSASAASQVSDRASAAAGPTIETRVVAVPWLGQPELDHQVWDGGSLTLKAAAYPATGRTITGATWDPGDGTGPQAVPVTDPYELELVHTYTGLVGTPYVARVEVTDSNGDTATDTFRVRVLTQRLDVEVNRAIDEGLWYIHKQIVRSSINNVPSGYWNNQNTAADTASCVLAFQVMNHLPSADPEEDPYVDNVRRGLAHLFTEIGPVAIGTQNGEDPDANGNGFGLQVDGSAQPIYVGGQVIDAFVASRTPDALAPTGVDPEVLGRRYADIVQDMVDAYSWGQDDSGSDAGGWRYSWNSDSDNSAAQWWAIGGIAAERNFDAVIPQWVKELNRTVWLTYSQTFDQSNAGSDGLFGYTNTSPIDVGGMNTTPSGLVQLICDGVLNDDPRFLAATRFMARNWNTLANSNRIYGMFATAKAMRLALPLSILELDNGLPVPDDITFEWYGAETDDGDPVDGLARVLVDDQLANGSWDGYWVIDELATAWAVVVLSPSIFTAFPVAICQADPETTGVDVPIEFDGSQSFHIQPLDYEIVAYEWDFDDDGVVDATGETVFQAFDTLGDYPVRLTVRDNQEPPVEDADTCTIHIVPPPIPPNADAGGPYDFCIGTNEPFFLDGTGSSDPDGEIVEYAWEYTPQPIDNSFDDATTPVVDVTAFFTALGPGVYDVGLRVTDDDGGQNTEYTTVRVFDGDCPAEPDCNTGEPLVLDERVPFTQLDGSPSDLDTMANGVLLLDGLEIKSAGAIVVDLPSIEIIVRGQILMHHLATIAPDTPAAFDPGPDIFIQTCDSLIMRDFARIYSSGKNAGGRIRICAADSVIMRYIAGIEASPEINCPGRSGGTVQIECGGNFRMLDEHTYVTVFAENAGSIEVAACGDNQTAVRLEGRLIASGWNQNGVGGNVLVDARSGGIWLPGVDHVTAVGNVMDGEIELRALTTLMPPGAPLVSPDPAVTLGEQGPPCTCQPDPMASR